MFATVNDTDRWVVAASGCYQTFESQAEAEAVYEQLAPVGIEAAVFGSIQILPPHSRPAIPPEFVDRVQLDYMSQHKRETDLLALMKTKEETLASRTTSASRFGVNIDPIELIKAMKEYIEIHEAWESFLGPEEMARVRAELIAAAERLIDQGPSATERRTA